MIGSRERHPSRRIFSGRAPLVWCFNAMRDCIAHQVQQRIGNYIGKRFLDANVGALDLKFHVLSQMTSCDSAGTCGRALQNFAGGNQPQLDQPFFKGDESHA